MSDAGDVVVRVAPVVGELRVRVRVDSKGEWLATVVHQPGCIGDGPTKLDAVTNAIKLYLHLLIMKMNRGDWEPRLRKYESTDLQ